MKTKSINKFSTEEVTNHLSSIGKIYEDYINKVQQGEESVDNAYLYMEKMLDKAPGISKKSGLDQDSISKIINELFNFDIPPEEHSTPKEAYSSQIYDAIESVMESSSYNNR